MCGVALRSGDSLHCTLCMDAEDRVSAEEELTASSSTSDLLRKLTCLQPGNTDG